MFVNAVALVYAGACAGSPATSPILLQLSANQVVIVIVEGGTLRANVTLGAGAP